MKKVLFVISLVAISFTGFFATNTTTITGVVTDASTGTAFPGVAVMAKESGQTVYTDSKGKFKIEVVPEEMYLAFSFLGYETQEVKIKGRTIIKVALKMDKYYGDIIEDDLEIELAEECEVAPVKSMDKSTSSANRSAKRWKKGKRAGMPKMSMACGGAGMVGYDMAKPDFNTENYSTINENTFKEVVANPLSTFSIDVDAASYSNMRRFINQGSKPPKDAVRIEEMINYFSYEYPQPEDDKPFSITTELSECPWKLDNYLLHVGIQGKKIPTENLPASNLVFLVDVSGSMQDANKLPLLKQAFKMLVDNLRPQDKVSMVVYAGAAGVVLPATSGVHKKDITNALEKLSAGGSTAGGEGLMLAYKIAEENFIKGGNNRILLATDGDFNVGVSSNSAMERLVEKKRDKGIFMTVLGFGMGNYKDDRLEIIADKGNGNYAYIDNIMEAKKVFINEFGGTLFTIAKDVKIQIEFNPGQVKAYRLVGYENRLLNDEDFNDDKKDAGEIGSGHSVTALYEIIPAGSENNSDYIRDVDPLKYQKSSINDKANQSNELLTLKVRYKEPDGDTSKLIVSTVENTPIKSNQVSDNFKFSAAVAEFGMVLRNSEFKGVATIDHVISLASNSKSKDAEGYRSEFIQLVKTSRFLD